MDEHRFTRLKEADGAPLYEVVKRELSEAILLGHWCAGDVLPSETTLSREFGVSVGTMRRALTELTQEGLVMRRRKTGTVVTGRAPHQNLKYFFQYFRLHDAEGRLLRSTTCWQSMTPGGANDEEAKKLACEVGEPVLRLARVRLIDECPVMHESITLPTKRLGAEFPTTLEALPDLLYRYLFHAHGIRIAAVREQIHASLAEPSDCEILNLNAPHAILVIDDVSFDQSSRPVLMAHHRTVTDPLQYINEIR